jgi:hypothetical protein
MSDYDHIADLGRKLVTLGEALQNKNVTITELSRLAGFCGLSFKFKAEAVPVRNSSDDWDGPGSR